MQLHDLTSPINWATTISYYIRGSNMTLVFLGQSLSKFQIVLFSENAGDGLKDGARTHLAPTVDHLSNNFFSPYRFRNLATNDKNH